MIIEDSQIMPSSLTQIFKNPEQRKRILKILIQTLYNLGFEQSAAELETESKITYLTPQIKSVKNALPQQNYDEVERLLINNPKFPQVKDVLNQLKCLKMIKEGKMQQALNLIQNQIKQDKKKEQLSEQLMMGTGVLSQDNLRKKHHFIVQTCFDSDISPNSMFKMINCYVQLQKRGLTASISPQFSLLKKPTILRRPPMRIIQTSTSVHLKNISFIKFNRRGDKVLIISSQKKQKFASVWNLNKQKASLSEHKNCVFSIDEQIVNISWNFQPNQLIAMATTSHLCVFSSDFTTKFKKKIPTGLHNSQRILCLNWNPLTNFLYVGGAFENIKVFGSTLQQIISIQPFIRTRILCFNEEGTNMYSVSATKGLFIYYNLFENKQQAQFTTEDAITSFRLENKNKNIVLVTQTKILYILVEMQKTKKFTVLHSFINNFSENGLVQIEACLFHPWIVCLGQKQFQAFGLEKDVSKQQKWNSKSSFTFDIAQNFMVSGSKQLYLWGSQGFHDDIPESENQSSLMQIEDNHKNGRSHPNNSQNNQQQNSNEQNQQQQAEEQHQQQSVGIQDSQMQEF